MSVKEVLKKIRETDARLAEARRALAAAEARRSALEDNLAALLAEGNEPNEKKLAEAGTLFVEVEARRRALARLEQERTRLVENLLEARVRELREEAQRAEKEVAKMQDEAYAHLQKAGSALGLKDPVPLALVLRAGGLVPADPRDLSGFGDHFWSVDGSRWAELSGKARELQARAEVIASHPLHKREEIQRLLGEEVPQNA
jgi:seryl-tRNA synthetase